MRTAASSSRSHVAEAIALANAAAPEHLVVDDDRMASKVRCAGSLFVGAWSAQVAGDYAIGSNHVLPTAGAARVRGGLSAADFVRQITVQRLTRGRPPPHRPDGGRSGDGRGADGARRIGRDSDEEPAAPKPQAKAEPRHDLIVTASGLSGSRSGAAAPPEREHRRLLDARCSTPFVAWIRATCRPTRRIRN